MRAVIPIPYVPNLNTEQVRLLQATIDAHQTAALKNENNASAFAFWNSMAGSGRVESAIASFCLAIGHLHAPILEARGLYEEGERLNVLGRLNDGQKIAGFGNSFYKTSLDPAWDEVMNVIRMSFPKTDARIQELCSWMAEGGKPLYPNAALLTGAVCSELKIPHALETSLFVVWRIPALIGALADRRNRGPKPKSRIIA